MEGFNRRPSFGGGRGFGGRRSGGFRGKFNQGPREMHKATCSECKKECEVPFKPSNDAEGNPRPVFCKECYFKRKDAQEGSTPRAPRTEAPRSEDVEDESASENF